MLFKKKPKKSHKNDEIFIDYSKEIDVNLNMEDEAKPEHYKALKIEDEIVVSTTQITEAIQQKKQSEFIDQRLNKEHSTKAFVSDEQTTKIEDVVKPGVEKVDEFSQHECEKELEEEKNLDTQDNRFVEDEVEQTMDSDDTLEEEHIHEEERTSAIESESRMKKETQIAHFDEEEIDDYEEEEEEEPEHRAYPSFLHEELSVRRNLSPLPSAKVEEEENQHTADIDDSVDTEVSQKEEKEESNVLVEESELVELDETDEKHQDLSSYFVVDNSVLKKGRKNKKKVRNVAEEDSPKEAKYQYKDQSFYSIEEFIEFLESHLGNLDEIAHKILKDESFFRWIKSESKTFEESITNMKKLKQQLKQ